MLDINLMAIKTFLIDLLLALLIIVLGYIVSTIVGSIVTVISRKLRIDYYLKKTKRADAFGGLKGSEILGQLAKWALFAAFVASAADYINLANISSLLMTISRAIITLIYAAIIVIIGLLIADFFADKVKEMKDLPRKDIISKIIRGVIIIATLDIAVKTIGINVAFIETLILVIVGAFALGAGLAIGIAFGLGGKEEAKKILEGVKTKIKSKKSE